MSDFWDFFFMKIFIPFAVLLLILCVFGLGYAIYDEYRPPTITEGIVTELEYMPEDNDVIMMPIVISNGKTTTTMMTPTYIHHDEAFRVVIKDGKETEDFYVDKKTYKQLKVGIRYRAGNDVENTRPETSRDASEEEQKRMED